MHICIPFHTAVASYHITRLLFHSLILLAQTILRYVSKIMIPKNPTPTLIVWEDAFGDVSATVWYEEDVCECVKKKGDGRGSLDFGGEVISYEKFESTVDLFCPSVE